MTRHLGWRSGVLQQQVLTLAISTSRHILGLRRLLREVSGSSGRILEAPHAATGEDFRALFVVAVSRSAR